MTTEQALNILVNTALLAQKSGALTLDDAVQVRNAIAVFQKPATPQQPEVEPEVSAETE